MTDRVNKLSILYLKQKCKIGDLVMVRDGMSNISQTFKIIDVEKTKDYRKLYKVKLELMEIAFKKPVN